MASFMKLMKSQSASSSSSSQDNEEEDYEAVKRLKPEEREVRYKKQLQDATKLAGSDPWLFHLPFINRYDDIEVVAQHWAAKNPNDFTWALSFDPDFIASLMYHGFLTMCEKLDRDKYILFPKLHVNRCIMDLDKLHVSKSTKKKSHRGYLLSFDKAFETVCAEIVRQHGENWFHKPLVAAFKKMNDRGPRGCYDGKVFMHSVELWLEDKLVAGEVGYVCGACYTSLSGFSLQNSAGSIQMAGLGSFLFEKGFKLWDLGMILSYKKEMGAVSVPRAEFLDKLKRYRTTPNIPFLTHAETEIHSDPIQVGPIIDRFFRFQQENLKQTTYDANQVAGTSSIQQQQQPPQPPPNENPLSKTQLKKLAKRQRREAHKSNQAST